MKERITELQLKFHKASPQDVIGWIAGEYKDRVTFSTSLGAEDQVITHMIAALGVHVRIFTLDTGRLFQETYDLLDLTMKKYNLDISVFFPDAVRVETMVAEKGINLFYDSVENRRRCCDTRKSEPLKRALGEMDVWITGMRQDQSVTRSDASLVAWDEANQVIKINPLIHWNNEMVWTYLNDNHVPVNELHGRGYPSIGCLPCTRAVAPGEEIRAGRWWWELPEFKECGLHK